MEIAESPSKIELCRSNSLIKRIALLAARVSTKTTEDGKGIISDKAVKTSAFKSSNMAPSKLVFSSSGSGGFQTILLG